jgi:hypothetical protein
VISPNPGKRNRPSGGQVRQLISPLRIGAAGAGDRGIRPIATFPKKGTEPVFLLLFFLLNFPKYVPCLTESQEIPAGPVSLRASSRHLFPFLCASLTQTPVLSRDGSVSCDSDSQIYQLPGAPQLWREFTESRTRRPVVSNVSSGIPVPTGFFHSDTPGKPFLDPQALPVRYNRRGELTTG